VETVLAATSVIDRPHQSARLRGARQTPNVSIRLTRPGHEALTRLADSAAHDELTYAPVGVTITGEAPDGYRLDQWSIVIGEGQAVFDRATDAIRQWQPHRGAGIAVSADEPPALGLIVAMAAPLPIGFIHAVCRVVAVVDEPDRYGFAYGTLLDHPEQGEESFIVTRDSDGTIAFEIVAVSCPRHFLARACPPLARRLQRAATKRYLDAMRLAVAG
jgi:uncharacterized protein (UPF0548 family)